MLHVIRDVYVATVLVQISSRMNVKILSSLTLCSILIATCSSIVIPCSYYFKPKHGYTCVVGDDFSNRSNASHITKIEGDAGPLPATSVNRIVMFKLDVALLPGNLTEFFPYLKALQVKSCHLKNLTRSTELNRLQKLYLGFNDIDEIPVVYFWNFCKLRVLSLFSNQISAIPKMAFRDLKSLEKLSLSQNRLTFLHPYLLECTPKLISIDLDGNLLTRIQDNLFAQCMSLVRLSMESNEIVEIGNDFLANQKSLKSVSLKRNGCINEAFSTRQTTTKKGAKSTTLSMSIHQRFAHIFEKNCSPPTTTSTTTPHPTTTPAKKKPPHQREKIFFFENCEWHKPPNHRYF